jgi:hypothetical protein
LKMWQCSDIWKQYYKIKITSMKQWRAA